MRRPVPVLTLASLGAGLLVALPVLATPAAAQRAAAPTDPAKVATLPTMKRVLDSLRVTNAWTLDQQASICEVPAPPFKEKARGEELMRRFRQHGLQGVRVDAEGNVIGERPGSVQDGPTIVISGHLDTVFPEGTDVKVKRDKAQDGSARLTAPGIGDDCRGLAVVLAVARSLNAAKVQTRGTILFVGTVGEEGPGNLRGVRHLFGTSLKGQVNYFISVDGTGLDLTKDAVGSNRYRVTYKGPGGHSYGAFGMPNPVHALGRAIAKVSDFQVPREPRVTFNVGVIEGGTSVNSIAFAASMDVDMRSPDPAALARLDAQFQKAIRAALEEENARWPGKVSLTVEVDTIGIRPAGSQPQTAPIVQAGLRSGTALGIKPQTNASSTDANIPISLGIPAVTIDGGGEGRGAHSLDESFDTRNSHLGTQWALLYVLTLAGVR